MRNLTRREVLKAGSAAAVTAMFNPSLGNAENEKEGNDVREFELVQARGEEICFMEATALVELIQTKKVSSVEVMRAHPVTADSGIVSVMAIYRQPSTGIGQPSAVSRTAQHRRNQGRRL